MRNLTIREFIGLKENRGIRLVAGGDGQDRIITNVNIMDNPDTVKWLREGELLLTTGFVFKDDPALQANLIEQLAGRNCAGLGLKSKRYFDTIPHPMIEQANECQFPLLELPFEYSLSQISYVVYQEILNRQAALLAKSQDIHKCLTQVSLAGGSLEQIVALLVELIGNPVLVLDSKWRLLSYGECSENRHPLSQYLHLIKGQQVFPAEFTSDVPREVNLWEQSIKRLYGCRQHKVPCRIKPVVAAGHMYGYIVVWESVRKLTRIDYVAVEHASTVIALERIKQQAVAETKHRIRADFFDDLLAGKIESVNAVRTLGEIHGLYTDKPYVCLVVEIHSNQKGAPRFHPISGIYLRLGAEADNYPLEKAISKLVERTTAHEYGGAVTIVRPNKIIVFLPVDSDTDKRTTKLDIRALANRMHENIKSKFEQLDYSIGIGQPCQTVLDLKQSFLEALEAIRMARKIACSHRTAHFEDFMVYHLLDTISDQGELENFFHNTVGKLVQYDQDNNTDFVKTLEVFFTCKGNVSDAAKQLFIHRNTMMYRLDRIKSILSVDLEDAEQLLELNLGLKAMRVLTLQEKKPGSK